MARTTSRTSSDLVAGPNRAARFGASRSNRGFTIVELLIVIVVIAILAAISIVAYTGIQSRAHDTRLLAESRQIETKLQEHAVVEGSLGVEAWMLEDKESVLAEYGLTSFEENIDYHTSEIPMNEYDRRKIFLRAYPTELNWSYWSNEKNAWIVHRADSAGNVTKWEAGHPDPWAGM
ncbi:prepilin-type N-terminal cleavage/methylation domain-containing protein [Gulosibacter macacae]|uniref:Prepilin-type N-terminal cleavage/methylation domain-containing protein n=1 Tax=Gulosibacter macacae TaxID=2488791 RepID=A0A3P3VST1_9MICO|nr:prepilin-type N-terminal cleavage/methylation domain-containing protein [Gulosibacter macacae]RRJ85700.1 prepilin-type N-terminal cleavage/methylation domain-containing protein [Gulosibacter macacae]